MKNVLLSRMSLKTYLPWALAAGCYGLFTALLSYWYPYTIDETRYAPKTAALICAFCFLFVAPVFMRPYYDLHKQELQRNCVVAEAKRAQSPWVALRGYKAGRGPSDNLSIDFNDTLSLNKKKLRDLFGLDITVCD